jgi:hypothetical protein
MGQLLDMTTESPEGKLDFSRFTMKVNANPPPLSLSLLFFRVY